MFFVKIVMNFFTGSYCVFEKYIYLCTAIERDSE